MIRDLIGKSRAATAVCRQEASRLLLGLLKLFLATALALCFMFLRGNEVSAANGDLVNLRLRLQELRTASSVVLMIVPYRTHFIVSVDEVQLRDVSCQYEINPSPTFDEVLNTLDNTMIEYEIGPKPHVDLRVGIVFKTNSKVVQEFYFNDSGGFYNVRGFSGDHTITALASLPNQLRALVSRPSVVLIKDPLSRCPHP
jgi:hypothetical protein